MNTGKLLTPKYAFPDSDGWGWLVKCDNGTTRRVSKQQFIRAFGEPKGRMIDVYDDGVFTEMDDSQYIDYLNLPFMRDELLARLTDLVNTEEQRIYKAAEVMIKNRHSPYEDHTDYAQDINIFGQETNAAA